jgi:hypothetical protein
MTGPRQNVTRWQQPRWPPFVRPRLHTTPVDGLGNVRDTPGPPLAFASGWLHAVPVRCRQSRHSGIDPGAGSFGLSGE